MGAGSCPHEDLSKDTGLASGSSALEKSSELGKSKGLNFLGKLLYSQGFGFCISKLGY